MVWSRLKDKMSKSFTFPNFGYQGPQSWLMPCFGVSQIQEPAEVQCNEILAIGPQLMIKIASFCPRVGGDTPMVV